MTHHSLSLLLAFGAAALLAGPVHAARPSEAQLRYQQERAVCMSGASSQDRATCLREASAALQEARRGNLTSGNLADNGIARCNAQPPADRQDCVMRIHGAGSTSGSVGGGGVLRELSRPATVN